MGYGCWCFGNHYLFSLPFLSTNTFSLVPWVFHFFNSCDKSALFCSLAPNKRIDYILPVNFGGCFKSFKLFVLFLSFLNRLLKKLVEQLLAWMVESFVYLIGLSWYPTVRCMPRLVIFPCLKYQVPTFFCFCFRYSHFPCSLRFWQKWQSFSCDDKGIASCFKIVFNLFLLLVRR